MSYFLFVFLFITKSITPVVLVFSFCMTIAFFYIKKIIAGGVVAIVFMFFLYLSDYIDGCIY